MLSAVRTEKSYGDGSAMNNEPDCLEIVLESQDDQRKAYCTDSIMLDTMSFFCFFNGTLYFLNFSFGIGGWEECGPCIGKLVETAIFKMKNADAEKLWSWFLEFNEKYGVVEADRHCMSLRTWLNDEDRKREECEFLVK